MNDGPRVYWVDYVILALAFIGLGYLAGEALLGCLRWLS